MAEARRPSPDADDTTRPAEKRPRIEIALEEPSGSASAALATPTLPTAKPKKRRAKKHSLPESYSPEDVLWRDVVVVLGQAAVDAALEGGVEYDAPLEEKAELDVEVRAIASSGEGLAVAPDLTSPWVFIVPLALPGEKVRVRAYRHGRLHSMCDLLAVHSPNLELRDESLIKCKHFGKCAGCQYQMLPYATQLDFKRTVVVKAYANFSDLTSSELPPIESTVGSPLEYGYRTKLTPHFEAPPRAAARQARKPGFADGEELPSWLKIGFNEIGRRNAMDIEECPIATPVIQQELQPTRQDIVRNIFTYSKGVSLILRDSLVRDVPPSIRTKKAQSPDPADDLDGAKHVCVTDHKTTVRERVGDTVFEYLSGSFFQNNNAVLPLLTSYVRDAIFPSTLAYEARPTHLVDAYCGSGLFALSLAPHFATVAGIELSADSIRYAQRNARLNGLADTCTFRAGDAADIFAAVREFPPAHTALVIDPPRKGCDERFLAQLLAARFQTVVYVSCNVHTQARDVGTILRRSRESGKRYVLESLRGFDLFPQTAHVESVAVLRLVANDEVAVEASESTF